MANNTTTKVKLGRPDISLQTLEAWVSCNDNNRSLMQELNLKRAFEDHFEPWALDNNLRLSYMSFIKASKSFLEKNNLTNPYVRGINSNVSITGNPFKAASSVKTKEEKLDLAYREKFEMIETYTESVRQGYINSLRIYGKPGIGKDFTVETVLGKDAVYFVGGGVKGTYELVKLLYLHRKDEIIVFSDFDSVLKTKDQINVMKTALEDKDNRKITWVDSTNRPKRDTIPTQFEFSSGIIYISNNKRIAEALESRYVSIKIDMNTTQTLDWIKFNLEGFMPKIPLNIKEEVWTYIYSIRHEIKLIDFRQFKYCVATKLMKPEKWKAWVKTLLNKQ